ncbi:ankyrin repeat-containing domain protein [Annulohypoxylon maeteangense]|uniref:ankyrin repeat-containing domain protein n=1 Tax=Annulohypoxylon maeteangense TaxID=1927788 RepID=UPI002007AE44|nr:ankyrin repeat-containing domain protein [Annulohypoxylon maeteangense]KAI0888604.1 ankyrin repeat-containing domain protein [Annulohypoxylon maeteangense]
MSSLNTLWKGDYPIQADVVVICPCDACPDQVSWWKNEFASKFPNCRVSLYMLELWDRLPGVFVAGKMQHEATRLLDSLDTLRKDDSKLPIMFIAQDIAGIFLKESLVIGSRYSESSKNICRRTKAIVFICSPHRTGSIKELDLALVRLVLAKKKIPEREAWKSASDLRDWVISTNDDFLATKIPLSSLILSTMSTSSDPDLRIFDQFTSSMLTPLEWLWGTGVSYDQVAKAIPWAELNLEGIIHENGEKLAYELRNLLSVAVPQYPAQELFPGQGLSGLDKFEQWKLSQGFRVLLLDLPHNGMDITSNVLANLIEPVAGPFSGRRLLYFVFKATDTHLNSIESMLVTLLCQLINYSQQLGREKLIDEIRATISTLPPSEFWKIDDLYFLFIDILLEIQASGAQVPVAILIGSLDKAPTSCIWLFRKLQLVAKDCELDIKVVGTVSDSSWLPSKDEIDVPILKVVDTPMDCDNTSQELNLKCLTGTGSHFAHCTDNNLNTTGVYISEVDGWSSLIRERPQLYACRKLLVELHQSCIHDWDLCQLIISWLRVADLPLSQSSVEKYLSELLPASVQKILDSVSLSITSADREWASSILEVLLYSFRPLTLSELSMINSPTKTKRDSVRSLSQRLSYVFKGLVTIQSGKVHLAHHDLRDLLLKRNNANSEYHIAIHEEKQVHQRLAKSCLAYLSSSEGEAAMSEGLVSPGPPFLDDRDNLLYYAVRYWPMHGIAADFNEATSSKLLRDFMENDGKRIGLWAMTYRSLDPLGLPNPLYPEPADPNDALLIFSKYNLGSFISPVMTRFQSLPSSKVKRSYALSIALGSDNTGLATRLGMDTSKEVADIPILAAIEIGHAKSISSFTSGVNDGTVPMKSIHPILSRAATLDMADFIRQLIKATENNTMDWDTEVPHTDGVSISPMYYAAQRNSLGVVDALLLSEKVRVRSIIWALLEDQDMEIIWISTCKFGYSEILTKLLQFSFSNEHISDETKFKCHQQAVQSAIKYGQHKILELLLQSKPQVDEQDRVNRDKMALRSAISSNRTMCCLSLIAHLKSQLGSDDTLIIQAIEMQNIQVCNELLRHTQRSTMEDKIGSFLSKAISTNSLPIVQAVYNRAEALGMEDITPMTEALGHTVKELIRLKDDFHDVLLWIYPRAVRNNNPKHLMVYDRTPLFNAAFQGTAWLCRALIEANVDVNGVGDSDMWYPIHAAADNVLITRMLIAAGADIDKKNSKGSTALKLALQWSCLDVVEALLEANPSQQTLSTGFVEAIQQGKTEIAERIIQANIRLSYPMPGANVDSILHRIVLSGHLSLVKLILEYNVNIDQATGRQKITPLCCIRETTDEGIVRMLVNRGADIEGAETNSPTPLSMAAFSNNIPAAKFLINRGAKVDAENLKSGPFHTACRHGSIDMVKLLRKRANVNKPLQTTSGTPLQAALLRKNKQWKNDIISYLLEDPDIDLGQKSAFWGDNVVGLACLTSDISLVQKLINHKAQTTSGDHLARKPIHFALYRTREHVELLLEHGGSLDSVDIMKRHALHFAAASGQLDTVKFVLERRSDLVNCGDCDNWTPLLWALRASHFWEVNQDTLLEIIRVLIREGAEKVIEGDGLDRSWTPLRLAVYYDLRKDIIDILTPNESELKGVEDPQAWRVGGRKKGVPSRGGYCDACLLMLWGVYHECIECADVSYCLCFKCYVSRDVVHPDHTFFSKGSEEEIEEEIEEENRDEEEEEDDEDMDSQEDDDEDTDSDGDSDGDMDIDE